MAWRYWASAPLKKCNCIALEDRLQADIMKPKPLFTALGNRERYRQRGGTVMGIVVGLIVGLGLALAVAVYVTKVPVPFVNKVPGRTADQDAAEARKNRDWDPNAPLQGKGKSGAVPAEAAGTAPAVASAPVPAAVPQVESGKPASESVSKSRSASGSVDSTAKTPEPRTADIATGKTEGKAEAKVDAKADAAAKAEADARARAAAERKAAASTDPLGELAKARSAPPPAAGSADPFAYFVQVGAYREPRDADGLRAKLSLMGIDARVTEREQSGRTVYRVRVGPFDRKEDADGMRVRLEANALEAALVRVQR
jgi:cell division protein FtsN